MKRARQNQERRWHAKQTGKSLQQSKGKGNEGDEGRYQRVMDTKDFEAILYALRQSSRDGQWRIQEPGAGVQTILL
ncbi:hypothetical protein A2U01_0056879 [Trifolium medium]|uniref:Uncharacterized protein n=1 Tax=Trifolium medium TaxID=97028 RepID=A0A392RGB6_9FABA|nr:hypothetical protein [Trifolium medium]